MRMKRAKLFRSGGSWAVRIPREWVPESGRVVLTRENGRIIVEEEGGDLRALARRFAEEGRCAYPRPSQPKTPAIREV
jgi:virulence-associated protein VagC